MFPEPPPEFFGLVSQLSVLRELAGIGYNYLFFIEVAFSSGVISCLNKVEFYWWLLSYCKKYQLNFRSIKYTWFFPKHVAPVLHLEK